jgi:hypothetical protein
VELCQAEFVKKASGEREEATRREGPEGFERKTFRIETQWSVTQNEN